MTFGTLESKIAEKAEKRYNKLCADFNKEAARYQKKIKKLKDENVRLKGQLALANHELQKIEAEHHFVPGMMDDPFDGNVGDF